MKTKYQVVIIGGTLSSITAAIDSAREGFSTLLVEPTLNIGGKLSGRFLPSELKNYFNDDSLFKCDDLLLKYLQENILVSNLFTSWFNNISFQKYIIDQLINLNVTVALKSVVTAIRTTENKIHHVIISNGEKINVIETDLVIDCSSSMNSIQLLNPKMLLNGSHFQTSIIRFSGVDFVELLSDVREHPENYSTTSSQRYSSKEIITIGLNRNFLEKLGPVEFIFPPNLNESCLTFTKKFSEINSKNDAPEILEELKNNCTGFKNIITLEISNYKNYCLDIELYNSHLVNNKITNLIIATDSLQEEAYINPLSVESYTTLFRLGKSAALKISGIIKNREDKK